MPDQLAEDAVAARRVADPLALGLADATRDEAPQLAAVVVEHPERGVARPGQLARDAQELLEHGVDLELGHQHATRVEERRQACFVERCEPHGRDSTIRENPQQVRGSLRRGRLPLATPPILVA